MKSDYKRKLLACSSMFLVACLSASLVSAQHRGDNLAFQGLDLVNRSGVRALAMAGAYTAVSGELDALFWNPAGLIGIQGLQLSANFSSHDRLWREAQDYRPNRQVVTMSFILDGLYQPNPEFNGFLDNEAFFEDSTYVISEPLLGEDNYSEAAADWQKKLDGSGLNNIAAAVPFNFSNKAFVVSAGYNRRVLVTNYDRNQTHLSPHPAWDGYGDLPERVTAAEDSVRINWSDFERQRSGPLKLLTAALAVGLTDNINLGVGINRLTGETREFQALNRIGNFDLVEGIQIFRFSYDTLNVFTEGTSNFSATSFSLGANFSIGRLNLGANITPSYTITRDWSNTSRTTTVEASFSESESGEDKLSVPLSYNIGVSLSPHDKFRVALDIENRPYSDADFTLSAADTTHRNWANQTSFRVGAEFKPLDKLSLLAGYRNVPQVFIPDGAADLDRGPEMEAYTLGASVSVDFIRFDLAYEIATLKYYDVYFSNTNFVFERFNNLLLGLTLTY